MQKPAAKAKTPVSKRQIPTLLGLGVLIVSLIAGLMMFGEGTGVFAPRATPQTTPKNVKVTNITDKSFTVVFYTDESTNGFVKYGTKPDSLKSQATDDRDQLSGGIGNYRLHHVTVRGLTPNTAYSYVLGTASGSNYDNNGVPFSTRTLAPPSAAPPTNKTIYGTVSTEAGAPAEGSIVFVSSEGVGEMSALVKSSGSWALALSNARKVDNTGYAELTDDSMVNITVQGVEPTKVSKFTNKISASQPVPEVTLGQAPQLDVLEEVSEEAATLSREDTAIELNTPIDDGTGLDSLNNLVDFAEEESTGSDELESGDSVLVDEVVAEEILDLATVSEGDVPVMVPQPIIKGKAAPNVEVSIEVNSETQIVQTVTADADGDFVLNIIELQKVLEPGDHSVTYSYVDPVSGQTVTKTQTFIVQATEEFTENTSPFGSGNPFPAEVTPTVEPTVSASTESAEPSTRSAIVATDSGTYNSGSVGHTLALIIGGLFFMFTGLWSWWLAQEVETVE